MNEYSILSGVYGTLGTPAAGNIPSGRYGASSWKDSSGNFWLYGGGHDDLWEFYPSTNEWAWMGGSPSGLYFSYAYGTLGMPTPGNNPGSRAGASSWIDSSGNFWLFGGEGGDSRFVYNNDLWEYQPTSGPLPTAGTPTFSPPEGTYSGPQSVTINDTTNGTIIYYTTDGSTPSPTTSAQYISSSPITVAYPQTVKAIAMASGCYPSEGSATYTLPSRAATPTFSPPGGTYTVPQTITISDATPNATIYYSFSGTPTTSSTVYSGPNSITYYGPIEAIAVADGFSVSPTASATYVINSQVATPVFSVAPGSYVTAQTVAISDATVGSTIYYAINTPATTSSTVYSAPIAVNSSETIYVLATASGGTSSAISGTYIIGNPATLAVSLATSVTTIQSLTVTVQIDGIILMNGFTYNPTPTGTVTLTGDGYTSTQTISYGGAQHNGSVSLQFNIPAGALNTGRFTFTATYTPDANSSSNYNSATSQSPQVTVTVIPAVTVTPGSSSITTTQPLPVTVAVSAGNGYPAPTGSVTLNTGLYTSPAATLTNGSASITIPGGSLTIPGGSLTAANYIITANYTPDTNSSLTFHTASGTSSTVAVSKTTPTVSVTPGSYNITTAQALTVTVAVNGTPAPTGWVTLIGGYNSGAIYLSNGSASITIPAGALSAGNNTFTANYTPDNNGNAIYYTATGTSSAVTVTVAQNPAPVLSGITPGYASAGGGVFTLTVNGTGFISGSTVYWGTSALVTTFGSATQLTAQVPAADIATAGVTTAITVQTPTPGGGTSNASQFEVNSASGSTTGPTFNSTTATITAGSPASYPITLPSTVQSAYVTCLNLPTGATCSYSSATNTVTITTTAATPKGTYQITIVFTETVAGAATGWILLPFLLLPLVFLRRKLAARGVWVSACLGVVLLAAAAVACTGCGGGSNGGGSGGGTPQTHQVVSSGVVTLTVQ
jgi:hypothetical protein